MLSLFNSIASIFGNILNLIYSFTGNYGIAIILFTLFYKLLLLPITYYQRNSNQKMVGLKEKQDRIKEKYKGNDKKINEEILNLYKDNNISPFSGCLGFIGVIFNLIFVLSMFTLVNDPIRHMKKIDEDKYRQYEVQMYKEEIAKNKEEKENKEKKENKENIEEKQEETKKENVENSDETEEKISEEVKNKKITDDEIKKLRKESRINRPQLKLINRFGKEDPDFNINVDFLTLNLVESPMESLSKINFKDINSLHNLRVLVIPVIYLGITIFNIFLNKKRKDEADKEKNKVNEVIKESKVVKEVKNEEELEKEKDSKTLDLKELQNIESKEIDKDDEILDKNNALEAMQDANGSLMYFMPAIMFIVTVSAPQALGLYWAVQSILSMIENESLKLIFDKKTKKANEEK